jgi:hypothetical protein
MKIKHEAVIMYISGHKKIHLEEHNPHKKKKECKVIVFPSPFPYHHLPCGGKKTHKYRKIDNFFSCINNHLITAG